MPAPPNNVMESVMIDIKIIDDRIPHDVLMDCVTAAELADSYKVLHLAGDGSYGFKYNWTFRDTNEPEGFTNPALVRLWDEVKKHVPANTRLHRGYINAHSFGIEDTIHSDDHDLKAGLTVIVYLTRGWYAGWGGQTMFFKNFDQLNNEITQSVLPRYNRMVVFNKDIPHCVAPLSHRFAGIRLTCMFKLELLDDAA